MTGSALAQDNGSAAAHGLDEAERGAGQASASVQLPAPRTDQAHRSSVPVEDYLAVVAHELRTPLTAARAGLAVLSRDDLGPGLRAQVSGQVLDRLQQLDRLCADVLDAVSVATGLIALTPRPVDLTRAVADSCRNAGLLEPTGPSVHAHVDPARLPQLLDALLSHLSRRGGSIRFAVQALDDVALLTARIEGLALGPDEAGHLLEPFQFAARGDGNGLAVYVLRTLAVASGGEVGVEGNDDSTMFWIQLPLAEAP